MDMKRPIKKTNAKNNADFVKQAKNKKMKKEKIKIGKSIKRIREERGLTQKDVAEALKLHRITYSGWERDVSEPSLCVIVKMAEYFECSLNELILGVNK